MLYHQGLQTFEFSVAELKIQVGDLRFQHKINQEHLFHLWLYEQPSFQNRGMFPTLDKTTQHHCIQ